MIKLKIRKTSAGKYDRKPALERVVTLRSPADKNNNGMETKRAVERTETGLLSPVMPQTPILVVPAQIRSINVNKISAKNNLQLKLATGKTPQAKSSRQSQTHRTLKKIQSKSHMKNVQQLNQVSTNLNTASTTTGATAFAQQKGSYYDSNGLNTQYTTIDNKPKYQLTNEKRIFETVSANKQK